MDTSIIESNVRMIPIDMPYVRTALLGIVGALDELDERTRLLNKALADMLGTIQAWERTRPEDLTVGVKFTTGTIPGCYCRECKHYQEDDEIEGLGWCECSHPDAHATGIASREYGCVFGELREAE